MCWRVKESTIKYYTGTIVANRNYPVVTLTTGKGEVALSEDSLEYGWEEKPIDIFNRMVPVDLMEVEMPTFLSPCFPIYKRKRLA